MTTAVPWAKLTVASTAKVCCCLRMAWPCAFILHFVNPFVFDIPCSGLQMSIISLQVTFCSCLIPPTPFPRYTRVYFLCSSALPLQQIKHITAVFLLLMFYPPVSLFRAIYLYSCTLVTHLPDPYISNIFPPRRPCPCPWYRCCRPLWLFECVAMGTRCAVNRFCGAGLLPRPSDSRGRYPRGYVLIWSRKCGVPLFSQ